MNDNPSFRRQQPVAWAYHRNTSRWPFNVIETTDVSGYQQPPKEYASQPYLKLPVSRPPDTTLDAALRLRVSCRAFLDDELPLSGLATVLHAGYGVLNRTQFGSLEFLERPVPSGGGLYPLELYVLVRKVEDVAPGIYHYAPIGHALERLSDLDLPRGFLSYLFMGQTYVSDASAILVLTAVPDRSLRKYGDRGYRYFLIEAGHAGQNVNLVAAALSLGTLNLGGFFDQDLSSLLELETDEEIPLYAIALGVPATADRNSGRLSEA